jgi:putative hydrolase of the HAD superfamily
LITKGDLAHQESKVARSGLANHFELIEVVSEKSPATYSRIVDRLGIGVDDFLMVGNSMRSDIEPVLAIGGSAVHVAHAHTWAHEVSESQTGHDRLHVVDNIAQIVPLLSKTAS